MSDPIEKLVMPKFGMSMTQGTLVEWLVSEGTVLAVGDDVAEVETEKINGVIEAQTAGVLRRRVVAPGETVPVGALIGVVASAAVSDTDIEMFIERFRATFVPDENEEDVGPETEVVELSGKRIQYLRHGEGEEVVVLVHGFGGDLEGWLFNQSALASGRTVYALDLWGPRRLDEGCRER
jgi:pyruvate dehydrogenase E2 component (dihydrolipoamide acetyltransferase)